MYEKTNTNPNGKGTLHLRKDRKPRPEAKPKQVKGHEAVVKDVRERGAYLAINITRGVVFGKVVDSDKFTLILEVPAPTGPVKMVLFKHAISSFVEISEEQYQTAIGEMIAKK